nr:hypothetical protein [uncultured Methanospirillum sp.]
MDDICPHNGSTTRKQATRIGMMKYTNEMTVTLRPFMSMNPQFFISGAGVIP